MTANPHPNHFTLERLVANDLAGDERNTVELHVESCDTCRADLDALKADEQAFRAEIPYAPFRIEHEKRRQARRGRPAWLRLWLPSLATVAAAAGIALFVAIPQTQVDDGIRIKGGGTALTFSVFDAGSLRPGVPGETLAPGTRLQLSYDAGDNTHMAVVSIDAAGNTSRYFPDVQEVGNTLAPLPGGSIGRLPFSLTLDDTPGSERFFAVFATHAASMENLMSAVGDLRGSDPVGMGDLTLPRGLAQSSLLIRKP
ncbi:MAG: hypothetical protein V3T05_11210 [Myxococcota bacterium]